MAMNLGWSEPLTQELYINTALMGDIVTIDDDGFLLGMPTPMEMLEQHEASA